MPAIVGAFFCFYFARCSFMRKGILITKSKRIQGARAKVIGIFCIVLGVACIYLASHAYERFRAIPPTRA